MQGKNICCFKQCYGINICPPERNDLIADPLCFSFYKTPTMTLYISGVQTLLYPDYINRGLIIVAKITTPSSQQERTLLDIFLNVAGRTDLIGSMYRRREGLGDGAYGCACSPHRPRPRCRGRCLQPE